MGRWEVFLFGRRVGKTEKTAWQYNEENLEKLLRLQQEGGEAFFRFFFLMDASFMEWASGVQRRFTETLDEKETYLADTGTLPFPGAWIRLAFQIQAFRALSMKNEALLPHIYQGLDHLAAFLDLNPADRSKLSTVERYREELKNFSPGREESSFLSDGKTLKEVLRAYTQALPVFNAYHAKVEEQKAVFREEFRVFCRGIQNRLK